MNKITLSNIIIILMGLSLIILVFIRLTTPLKDGDFYWHISIGKYLVENKTLIPDHSVFSWTNADSTSTKSNWIYDILSYQLFEKFSLNVMFLIRNICFFVILIICIVYQKKSQISISPVTIPGLTHVNILECLFFWCWD